MIALSSLALKQGQNKEATTWLERAAEENPQAIQPAVVLATHYLRMGEKQRSLALAKKLQGTHPNEPAALELLAQTQFANNDKAGALESFNKLAAMQPESAPIQLRIASVQMAMDNLSAASESLKKALAIDPAFTDAQVAQASLEMRKGNPEQALAIARRIQKQQGKSPVGYALEGDILLAQEKPEEAAKAFEHALAIQKTGPLIVKLHASLSQAGKSREATPRLLEWLKQHPNDLSVRMYLAEFYLMNDQSKSAVEHYKIIVQQLPQYAPAVNNLASAYQQEKNPQALEYAEKAHQLAPENPAILDTLGWILVEQGNTSRGLPLLQKATSLAPQVPAIRYHLAYGLTQAGDKIKARRELEQALASGKRFAEMDEARTLLKQIQ
jgi:putative PEP-CTERM system TPR-repeat lipoprotein